MKAFLLAAGLGTRLRPITDSRPKCLIEIGGRSLLDRWLDALSGAGVTDVLVNTHHLADQVRDHLARRRVAPDVWLAHEPELLGSAGTLVTNRDFVAAEDMFLAVNVDNLTDFNPGVLIDAHRRNGTIATLSLFRSARPSECGIAEVKDGNIVAFAEKPTNPRSDLANAGIYAFASGVMDEIPAPLPRDIGYDLLPRLIGRAAAVELGDCYFRDIGTPDALRWARVEWEGRTL